jgi:hypothetical protein
MSNADFLAGNHVFAKVSGSSGSVVNQGRLTAAAGGYVALIGPGRGRCPHHQLRHGLLSNGKAVNVSGITLSSTDAGNYSFNTTAATTADITPKALTIAATGVNKVYDGLTGATVTLSDDRVAGDALLGSASLSDRTSRVLSRIVNEKNASADHLPPARSSTYVAASGDPRYTRWPRPLSIARSSEKSRISSLPPC